MSQRIAYADWVKTHPASHYPGLLPEDVGPDDVPDEQRRAHRLALPSSTVDAYNQGMTDAFAFCQTYMFWLWSMTHAPYQPSSHSARMSKHAMCQIVPPSREPASDKHDRECKQRAVKWGLSK